MFHKSRYILQESVKLHFDTFWTNEIFMIHVKLQCEIFRYFSDPTTDSKPKLTLNYYKTPQTFPIGTLNQTLALYYV
jgi:hypothetical protein